MIAAIRRSSETPTICSNAGTIKSGSFNRNGTVYPQVLKLPLPEIKQITLPVDAWKPGLRPDVLASYIQNATQEISERQMALANREMELLKAKERYEASENRPAAEDVTPSAESYVDDFSELDDQAWKVRQGMKLQDDGLAQLKDGERRYPAVTTAGPWTI